MEDDVQFIEKTILPGLKSGADTVQVINKLLKDENLDTSFRFMPLLFG